VSVSTPHHLQPVWTLDEVIACGERVLHLVPNDCYYAHLSVYAFASQFCAGKVVLDAGSGAGYGSAYLADHGARSVHAIDIAAQAVAFSREHFPRPNLHFHVMDLQRIAAFPSSDFDVVFCSNVLEHIPSVPAFLRCVWRLLKRDGLMVVAVPPITCKELEESNLANPYHLNIWSPRQWNHVLNQYFSDIACYRHGMNMPGVTLDFGNSPAQTKVRETDFTFEPIELGQYYSQPSLSAVFVARDPRPLYQLPPWGSPVSFIDGSFTRPPLK
jgi:2-polyprenyl-3-methyl-5-hydroxy-6-metoxy-1,4-benzoquinol methylase